MSKFYFWGVKYFCAIFVASGQYIKKFSVLKRRDNVHDFMKNMYIFSVHLVWTEQISYGYIFFLVEV